MERKTKRLTYKHMLKWLKETFDRLEIEWEPFEMYNTHLRSEDYHRGAAPYIIRARNKQNKSLEIHIRVEDWLENMQKCISTGHWKLHWEPYNSFFLDNSSITIKKC